MRKIIMLSIFCLLYTSILLANSYFTGYSGAPTSNGTCTNSCHGQDSFTPTCEITGFPEIYVPGQQYTITVRHNGGQSIDQFNCSIRSNFTSFAVGTITAGEETATYNTTNETNGIHWLTEVTDSGTFIWTAPEEGIGPVALYWAGLQGTRANGADQQIVLHSTEQGNSVDFIPALPVQFTLEQNYPNPFNNSTTINFHISRPGDITLEISNILGQKVYSLPMPDALTGQYGIDWNGIDNNGNSLPSGLYFYQLCTPEGNLTRVLQN